MNPQNSQTPLDYLNGIAPQAPKKRAFQFNLRTIALLGIIAIVIIIVISSISGAISGGKKEPWERLSARLATLAVITEESGDKIKNSQLRSLNSDLKLYVTNTQRDIAAPLGRANVDPLKLSANVIAAENSEAINARLEDGRLNAKYDSTYSREMTYLLATNLTLLQQLYASSGNPETLTFLKTAYDNLQPIYTAVSEFSASNE